MVERKLNVLFTDVYLQIKDNDNDGRKALRLVYFHLREIVFALHETGMLSSIQIDGIYEIMVSVDILKSSM